jgi:hypothetical protein
MLPCIGLSSDRSAVTDGKGPIQKRDRRNGQPPLCLSKRILIGRTCGRDDLQGMWIIQIE